MGVESKKFMSSVDIKARKLAAEKLAKAFEKAVEAILKGEEPKFIIPKRTLSNTIYDKERGLLLLGSATFERSFLDVREARKFMQTTLMAKIIYEALTNNEYPTIRDLYYRGKHSIRYRDHKGRTEEENTWDEQKESDAVLRDIEVYTGLLREEMLILSKEKGKVVGDMRIRSGDDVIDLSKMGHGAYAIEPTPDLIEFIDVNAEFVLVVEKDAVFQQLHRAGFWRKYKAILVTSAGQPDRATRRFVRRLNEELNLPVYILTDADPYGWYIYSVFRIGSITLSYESERLATPKAKFLGVSMTDIFGDKGKKPYLTEEERKNFIIKAKKADIKRAQEILNYEWFKTEKWQKEINIFLQKQSKLEIEALTGKGLYFLMDTYIPTKIQTQDFIE
ncbi:MAG: DNA topoisomerase IV subunit A [Ignisphaera sp.]|nr:DNA topoisomerase IV subunit A [Ignisphaera sp.]